MKAKEKKTDEVKLQPVSNEEVQQILNGDSKGMAYGCGSGCGSGCGCGCGEGSGCGCGDGSGCGSGDEYPKRISNDSEKYRDNLESSGSDSYEYFQFQASCVANASGEAKKLSKYDRWDVKIKNASFSFSVKGTRTYIGNDEYGNRLVYVSEGGDRSFPYVSPGSDTAYQTCEIACKGEYPDGRTVSLVAELSASLSASVDENSNPVRINFSLSPLSVHIRKK